MIAAQAPIMNITFECTDNTKVLRKMQSAPATFVDFPSLLEEDCSTKAGSSQASESKEKNTSELQKDQWTSVFIREIPYKFTQEQMLETVAEHGFIVDYLYLPRAGYDGKCTHNRGYCFANFISNEEACRFIKMFEGHAFDLTGRSKKRANISWTARQGFEAHIEYSSNLKVVGNLKPFIDYDIHRAHAQL